VSPGGNHPVAPVVVPSNLGLHSRPAQRRRGLPIRTSGRSAFTSNHDVQLPSLDVDRVQETESAGIA
jgi:hypothetical protein